MKENEWSQGILRDTDMCLAFRQAPFRDALYCGQFQALICVRRETSFCQWCKLLQDRCDHGDCGGGVPRCQNRIRIGVLGEALSAVAPTVLYLATRVTRKTKLGSVSGWATSQSKSFTSMQTIVLMVARASCCPGPEEQ
jgi:hypothetical protein